MVLTHTDIFKVSSSKSFFCENFFQNKKNLLIIFNNFFSYKKCQNPKKIIFLR